MNHGHGSYDPLSTQRRAVSGAFYYLRWIAALGKFERVIIIGSKESEGADRKWIEQSGFHMLTGVQAHDLLFIAEEERLSTDFSAKACVVDDFQPFPGLVETTEHVFIFADHLPISYMHRGDRNITCLGWKGWLEFAAMIGM